MTSTPSTVDTPPPTSAPDRRVAPGVVLLAAAAAGLIAATTVPLDRPGVGWLIAGVGVAAVVALAARALRPEGRVHRWWAVTTLALLAVGTFRASEWLFALCVLTACVTASLAMTGGRSVRELAVGAVAVPVAGLAELPWAARGAVAQSRRGGARPARITATVAASIALVVVFGGLLATADAAFGTLLDRLSPSVEGASVSRSALVFGTIGLGVVGACALLRTPRMLKPTPAVRLRSLRRFEWALPVATLVVLFAGFVAVQLTFLFGGSDFVLRTAGLTYAEYARQGFWQLSAVTVLTLLVIGVVAYHASTATAADRRWLRLLLGSLAVLTLVIVGSAMSRMWAYQQAYGFTVLRVLVSACEIWLGVIYLPVLAAGVRLHAGWLPRAIVGTAVASLLAIAALDPERFIAERNIDRWQTTGRIDVDYLGRLSADAAPALDRLPEPLRSSVAEELARNLARYRDDDWLSWNIARDHARTTLPVRPRTG